MPKPPIPIIHTVGHSNRSLDELIALLRQADIDCLVDIRAAPGSSRHPQFSQSALRHACEAAEIVYHWGGRELGGLRDGRPESPHTAIADAGLRAYADHMESGGFRKATEQLMRLAKRCRAAIMCAERLPEHCHRQLLADYLVINGAQVHHLIGPGETVVHTLTPTLRVRSRTLVYDDARGQIGMGLDS